MVRLWGEILGCITWWLIANGGNAYGNKPSHFKTRSQKEWARLVQALRQFSCKKQSGSSEKHFNPSQRWDSMDLHPWLIPDLSFPQRPRAPSAAHRPVEQLLSNQGSRVVGTTTPHGNSSRNSRSAVAMLITEACPRSTQGPAGTPREWSHVLTAAGYLQPLPDQTLSREREGRVPIEPRRTYRESGHLLSHIQQLFQNSWQETPVRFVICKGSLCICCLSLGHDLANGT